MPNDAIEFEIDNPYLLLTPGPLSTSRTVRAAMLRDWCTWDDDYNLGIVTPIREKLARIASAKSPEAYTATLMQGSGTFCVESAIGSSVPGDGKLLVLANGAYGQRLGKIAAALRIDSTVLDSGEMAPPDPVAVGAALDADPAITHVAVVHNETTTGMLNPLEEVAAAVKSRGRCLIIDAMSSFGGVPLDVSDLDADFLISSANKCLQGVPGFGFIIAKRTAIAACQGRARSLALDLFDQWQAMENGKGKWRFTSPTHTVRAFSQALREFEDEGGVAARHARYSENHRILIEGMERLGFRCLLPRGLQSPIITAFHNPESPNYSFNSYYAALKERGFVIYPGKVTNVDTFRIGTIGDVHPADFSRLIGAVEACMTW